MAAEEIKKLILLQQLDLQLDALQHGKNELPAKLSAIETALSAKQNALTAHKEKHRRLLLAKKDLENDLKTADDAIRKHQGELNSVKSNDAYKGLVKEIATCTADKDAIETKILLGMDELEASAKAEKPLQDAVNAEQAAAAAQKKTLQDEEAALAGQQAALAEKRARQAALVEAELLATYEHLRAKREGLGICQTKDLRGQLVCGGCNTALTQHMCGQVLRKNSINYCEECQRILYSPLTLLENTPHEA